MKAKQLLLITIFMTNINVFADDFSKVKLSDLGLHSNKTIGDRNPANFIPSDDYEPAPIIEAKSGLSKVFVEDNAGVLASMRKDFKDWEETEEYRKNWNIESFGLHDTPDRVSKKGYFNRNLLRYFDKRISGEVKNAEEGSTLHRVGQVQKALRPNANVAVSENVKFKFKARALQRKAMIIVDNPYVEYETNVNYKGEINMNMAKDIKPIGVKTSINYELHESTWSANIDRAITDQLVGRVSSVQSDKDMAFSGTSDRTVQLLYSLPF